MNTQQVGLTLKDILLSIADGLIEAREKLQEMAPYDSYGRPNTLYHLPYLDFSLELITEVRSAPRAVASSLNTSQAPKKFGAQAVLPRRSVSNLLNFAPATQVSGAQTTSSNKITSSISGRFVAIMPNEGLPQMFLTVNSERINNKNYRLIANLRLSTGEPVNGQLVEINYDKETSMLLSRANNFSSNPQFSPAVAGQTDQNGNFEINVSLAEDLADKIIIIVVNSGRLFKTIAL
ncbi:MAG: hypothetical protein N2050_04795 [Flavobacteriales bacterium]|nr:hypothetical protein [Flavobacteriales bacterium]